MLMKPMSRGLLPSASSPVGSALSQGLALCAMPPDINLVDGQAPTTVIHGGALSTEWGEAVLWDTAENRIIYPYPVMLNSVVKEITFAAVCCPSDEHAESGQGKRVLAWGSSVNDPAFHLEYDSSAPYFSFGGRCETDTRYTAYAPDASSPFGGCYIAVVRLLASQLQVFVNGRLLVTTSSVGGSTLNNRNSSIIVVGNEPVDSDRNRTFEGGILAVYAWNYGLPDGLVYQLMDYPFAPFTAGGMLPYDVAGTRTRVLGAGSI